MHKLKITTYASVKTDKPNFAIPDNDAIKLENNKLARDGASWHITIIEPAELSALLTSAARNKSITRNNKA